MKYRIFLVVIFVVIVVLNITAALSAYFISNKELMLSATILSIAVSCIATAILVIYRQNIKWVEQTRHRSRDLEGHITKLNAECSTKDLLLAREKEILLNKHGKLEEALDKQKKINMDLDKLKRDYEKIITLNNSIWFMDNPQDILEEISQHSVEAISARKCVILINDAKGYVFYLGASISTEEEKKPLDRLCGSAAITQNLAGKLKINRYIKIDRSEMPEAVAEFISADDNADYFAFPLYFRNELRGAAFISSAKNDKQIAKNHTSLEMFFSIVSVYFERSELINKEFELDNVLSEKEKLMSINNFIEGIAHNINSPLNAIMLSHELVENTIGILKEKYPEEVSIERLRKTTDRVKKAADTINGIVSNLTTKSMQDKMEKQDYMSINDIVKQEVEFLEADMEFKHNCQKELKLAPNLPVIWGLYRDYTYMIEAHIYICMYLLRNEKNKMISVGTSTEDNNVILDFFIPRAVPKEDVELIFSGALKQHIIKFNVTNLIKTRERYGIAHKFFITEKSTVIRLTIPVKIS